MPQVRTITTSVAGPKFREQGAAVEEFWRRMEAANGGRPEDPHDYISLVDVHWEEGRGWVIEYEVPAELLEQREVRVIREEPEPNCQNVLEPAKLADAAPTQVKFRNLIKCHVLSCMSPCIEGSSYCAEHQDKDARFKDTAQPTEIMPSLIQVTGHNPRKTFDPAQLEELKDSIREHGIIEPLLVRPKGNSRYELVVGERRLRAARELGFEHVPVVVRQLTDEQMLDIMLAENLQRVDLNPIEEAHHLKRVLEVGKLTQTELGRRVGKSQEWVSQRLRLAEAPAALQDLIIRRQINTSSAIEILQWRNTEHYDAIMHEIGAWSVEGEELPRARVREIIKEITDPTCVDCENSTWFKAKLICAYHGPVHPRGRYCEKFVAPSLGGGIDLPFVNPEDCKDCDIYDRATNTCLDGCTCDEECEDSFCEVTDEDDEVDGCEMFGVPGAADDEVCAVDCPDYDECKSEAAEQEEDDRDLSDETEPVADPADMAMGLKRNAMILELAKNRPMNCTCERDPWDNGVRTFECRICHEVFIDKKGMETVAMVTHLIGDGYHSDRRDAAQAVLAKAHLQPIKKALQRYFVGGSEVEDDVRIREHEADLAVKEFDAGSRWQGSAYLEERCRNGNKEAIEDRKKRNKLTEVRLKLRKEAEAKGVAL